jgi:hypothetical protein
MGDRACKMSISSRCSGRKKLDSPLDLATGFRVGEGVNATSWSRFVLKVTPLKPPCY